MCSRGVWLKEKYLILFTQAVYYISTTYSCIVIGRHYNSHLVSGLVPVEYCKLITHYSKIVGRTNLVNNSHVL